MGVPCCWAPCTPSSTPLIPIIVFFDETDWGVDDKQDNDSNKVLPGASPVFH